MHIRFFVALMLYDLYREQPVWRVAEKYQQNRGFVQNLLQTAISFASCVFYFSMVGCLSPSEHNHGDCSLAMMYT